MANNDDFLKVLAKNVTFQYPKLNQTYRFNTQKQASEPCAPTASNAAWSVAFEMTKDEARPLFEQLKAHYEACRGRSPKMPQFKTVFGMKKNEETGTVSFTAKRNGMKKDGTPNKAPTVIDGQKQPLADLSFWGGSKGTIRAWAVAVIDPDGNGGISLLLDAVQVTEAVYGGNGLDDFDTVESKADPFETKPLADNKRQAIQQSIDDEIPFMMEWR
ncbi:hypothetical protein UFOVP373_9 [uncultured Caudovirales phage]|uniref:Single-stranded DNA-binding protein n=1 Tax=uncultured Caudovirales phage TaxID=2100421 RepID=A0A6J7X012_9CAUD|nr:hypothetical protein UFOVP373_9 [uncultured Caudovirales phage]